MAEAAVKICENILRKCLRTGQDPHDLLLFYRNAEIPALRYSPSQLLFGRVLKDKIIWNEEVLLPKCPDIDVVTKRLNDLQLQQKCQYDKGCKTLTDLKGNDRVLFRLADSWQHGYVSGPANTPRSYWIEGENGKTYRQNRQHLIRIKGSSRLNRAAQPSTEDCGTQPTVQNLNDCGGDELIEEASTMKEDYFTNDEEHLPQEDVPFNRQNASKDSTHSRYGLRDRSNIRIPPRFKD
ncbi:hypothetical protein GE061_009732 [Apolygus lucorum]|uniref:Uncharacterized protein n=1 Tax=Apolygus lucorum TaxID=248454 RepID=A0A8S9Y2E1_APOLU|nr:hypothetical protein GE061_009732 [Apolygus lucorum]